MTFDPNTWQLAIRDLDPSLVRRIQWQAGYIVGELPTNYGSSNISAIAVPLSEARQSIETARLKSAVAGFFPERDCSDEELILWLTGLNACGLLGRA